MTTKVQLESHLPYTKVENIPTIVSAVRKSYNTGKTKSVAWRRKQLSALYDFVENEKKGICEALYADLRKPTVETEFLEIATVKADIATAMKHLDEWMEPVTAEKPLAFMADFAETRRVPLGVVLIIGTWNYPVNLTLAPLVGAIAGGNAAIIKFNEVSAYTSSFLARHLPRYLDTDAFQYILGDIPETTTLLEQQFDLIFYTGNSFVARIIQKAANKFLTPTVLELGGKSPIIVDSDVDLKITARRIMWGKVLNNGQTCVAPDYVLVHKKVAKGLVEELKVATKELAGENPETSHTYGRISTDRHYSRLEKMLKDQLAVEGTKVELGGETNPKDKFMAPTLLTGVGIDGETNPVMSDEIFGPILPIIEVDSIDQAIEYVNRRASPLAYYPFSRNNKTIEKVLENINGGNALANDVLVTLAVEDLPFGGVGESGSGNYHGRHGFETFTRKRATMIRTQAHDHWNTIRYQNVSYKKDTIGYKALMWAMEPAKPSAFAITMRNVFRKSRFFLQTVVFIGLIVGAFYVGKAQR
ncbi:Aldehyde dehydrogenase [Terramyces sp. JEL0728]|nr:Aldehyde dehydrogenase [Terramyces sp. JEL0728]